MKIYNGIVSELASSKKKTVSLNLGCSATFSRIQVEYELLFDRHLRNLVVFIFFLSEAKAKRDT